MADVNIKYRGSSIATMSASGTKTLGTQGKYCDSDVVVEYTKPASAVIESNKNATPSESAQEITPSPGYDAMEKVTVGAVSSSYVGSAVPRKSSSDLTTSGATVTAPAGYYENEATKTVSSGSAKPAASISATGATVSTGTNTLTLSKSVSNTPQVTAGYVSSGTSGNSSVSLTASVNTRSSSDLTASGATVTAPAGYYESSASKSVASGTAGTPTATKGTVSNHSVDVTPSVTNTTGYITGSTKTGTAVTVSASELVSGSETKTANGTYDVTNLAQLIVNVAGGGGSGLVYETGTYTPTSNTSRPTISFSNSHSTTPFLVAMSDTSSASTISSSSNTAFCFFDMYRLNGAGYPYSTSATYYAVAYYTYRGSSSSTTASVQCSYNSDNTGTSSTSYSRYWVTTTDFKPYTNSSSRYWRSGRTYKWIAVWKP